LQNSLTQINQPTKPTAPKNNHGNHKNQNKRMYEMKNNRHTYKVEFDCERCEMRITLVE